MLVNIENIKKNTDPLDFDLAQMNYANLNIDVVSIDKLNNDIIVKYKSGDFKDSYIIIDKRDLNLIHKNCSCEGICGHLIILLLYFLDNFDELKEIQEKLDNKITLRIDSYFDYEEFLTLESKYYENDTQKNIKDLDYSSIKIIENYRKKLTKLNIFDNCLTDLDEIVEFVQFHHKDFEEYGEVYLSETLTNLNIKKQTTASIRANYGVNLLDVSLSSDYTNDELTKILRAYKNKKKYVKLDDTILRVSEDDNKKILSLIEDFDLDECDLNKSVYKPHSYVLKLINEKDPVLDERLGTIVDEIKNFKDYKMDIPSNLVNVLREYQVDALKFLTVIAKHNLGAILADDMGLGKSLEILSLLCSDDKAQPTLIVAPTSLVYNWVNECYKWAKKHKVVLLNSSSAATRKNLIDKIDSYTKCIYVTSYDSLVRDIDIYRTRFRFIILDEAQYIKNPLTQKAKAVKKLNSEVYYALSGTPIENSLSDLWSIFDFILPGYLQSYGDFKERYEKLIMLQDLDALEDLKNKISPFVLRRTKNQVLKDLPDKIEEIVYAKLEGEQEKLYLAYLNEMKKSMQGKSKIEIIAMLTRLRQVCVAPSMFLNYKEKETKIDIAVDIISNAVANNHKILLFSQFTKSFEILQKRLSEIDITCYTLTGDTSAKARIELVDKFNKDDTNVFLISLKAGGTGLTLTSADIVIHLDPWWNASAQAQATDRTHRIGQKNVVTEIKIVCKGTIEEKVVLLQKEKLKLANSIISDSQIDNLELDNLDFLLS